MTRRTEGGRGGLETALRAGLAARAATIRVGPDLEDLAARIDRSQPALSRQGSLRGRDRPQQAHLRFVAAAAVVLVAAIAGGTLGSLLVPHHTQRAVLSASRGSAAGTLPTGPVDRAPSGPEAFSAGAPSLLHLVRGRVSSNLSRPARRVSRTTATGISLTAYSKWLPAVAIHSGAAFSGCFGGELVTTTAASGPVRGHTTGVVGIQPLSADGLEVVDSGTLARSGGTDIWWATIAVGSGVARVAAEQPGGLTDATRPASGLAVVGGVVPHSSTARFFSVVAENAAGQSLYSIGFLAGWGSRAAGIAPVSSSAHAATRGCPGPGHAGSFGKGPSRRRSAPLLASASVLAAFQQRYAGAGTGVEVLDLTFLSSREVAVVYRFGTGQLRTGTALRASSGLWVVLN
ncbi:MAG: hypothetical protein ACYDGN_00585 [Acidimicrobiales bacterium]